MKRRIVLSTVEFRTNLKEPGSLTLSTMGISDGESNSEEGTLKNDELGRMEGESRLIGDESFEHGQI